MGTKVEVKQGGGVNLFLVVLLCIVCGVCYYLFNQRKQARVESERLSATVSSLTSQVATGRNDLRMAQVRLNDSTRVWRSRTEVLAMRAADFQRQYSAQYKVSRKLAEKLLVLESYAEASISSSDTVYIETVKDKDGHDSFPPYRSKWIDIDVFYHPPAIAYEKRDSMILIRNIERKSLFWGLIRYGRKSEVFNAAMMDPKSKIIGLKVVDLIH